MWEGGALWVVNATPQATRQTQRTDPHAHHAIQVTLGLGGRFRLDTPGIHVGGDAVAVAPDAEHTFEADGLDLRGFFGPGNLRDFPWNKGADDGEALRS